MTKLRACRVRQNSKFRDRIDRRLNDESSVHIVEIVRAVDKEIVRLGPLSIDGVSLSVAQASARFRKARRDRHNAWLQQTKLGKIATVQRQVQHIPLIDGFAKTRDRSFHERCVRLDFGLLLDGPDRELNRYRNGLVHVERDS